MVSQCAHNAPPLCLAGSIPASANLFLVSRIGKYTGLLIPRRNALLVQVQDEEHLTKDKKVLDDPDKKNQKILLTDFRIVGSMMED